MGRAPESVDTGLDAPRLHMALPGPRAAALIEADRRYTSPSYTRVYPLVADHAAGAANGNRDRRFILGRTMFRHGNSCIRRLNANRYSGGGSLGGSTGGSSNNG